VLQKQRAIHMIFDAIQKNENSQVVAAIEYKGDVFLYDGKIYKVEEDKNYNSKNFSFNSGPVLNTMVYFLDYWINNSKSKNIVFSFYATNKVAKERSSQRIKKPGVTFPSEAILKLLTEKKY